MNYKLYFSYKLNFVDCVMKKWFQRVKLMSNRATVDALGLNNAIHLNWCHSS